MRRPPLSLASLALASAIGGSACQTQPAVAPRPSFAMPIEQQFVEAMNRELTASLAAEGYLELLDRAVADPLDPKALDAGLASLDALVFGNVPLAGVREHALVYRSRDLFFDVTRRLTVAWERGAPVVDGNGQASPLPPEAALVRGLIARALHEIALHAGDADAAKRWSARRGCATQATFVGPYASSGLLGLEGPSPISHTEPLRESYAGIAPFATQVRPLVGFADACALDVGITGPLLGARAVVVDVDLPRAERVAIALTSSSAAHVEAGGATVVTRPFDAGEGGILRMGSVELPQGPSRVVVRLAAKRDAGSLELVVLGDDGVALPMKAPTPGQAAPGAGRAPREVEVGAARALNAPGVKPKPLDGPASIALAAAARLATGEARRAVQLLELRSPLAEKTRDAPLVPTPVGDARARRAPAAVVGVGPTSAPSASIAPVVPAVGSASVSPVASGSSAPQAPARPAEAPEVRAAIAAEVLYARAISLTEDMPDDKLVERLRAVLSRVKSHRLVAWEMRLLEASLTERRKGRGQGTAEALKVLGVRRAEVEEGLHELRVQGADPLVTVALALLADSLRAVDVAEEAYAQLASRIPEAPLLAAVDARLHGRVGVEAVRAACNGALSRATLACFDALRQTGRHNEALAELSRVRALREAPTAYRDAEITTRLALGDAKGATAVYDGMQPTERRMLDLLGYLAAKGDAAAASLRFSRDRVAGRDAPHAFLSVSRLLGKEPDPSSRFEADGKKLVAEDKQQAFLPGAGTAVLRRVEEYDLDASGLLHFVGYDLRRVSGTTDVAAGGGLFGPSVEGRVSAHLLRRRIHKKDGRILEPDAAQLASQADSDLSQLEMGDYIEHVYEGWALPGDAGQLVLDTPDLLPERTSVREAIIRLTKPRALALPVWSHALLGKPSEAVDGERVTTTWKLENARPRPLESGTPRLERAVGISCGTLTWAQIGEAVRENLRSVSESDPYVGRWIRGVLAEGPSPADTKALVERVVAAVGKKVRVASGGGELSDVVASFGAGHHEAVRSVLERGEGSRTRVLLRALSELGLKAEIAIAETEPFASSPAFPPHFGRFRHPLVVVHAGAPLGDLWIDADVEGPPLPPGRISPELRGRSAILASGAIVPVEGASSDQGDEVDLRLVLDEHGDAKGSFTVLLRGRSAQSISDALDFVVGGDRRELFRSVVMGWLPRADVEDVQLSSSEGSWEVALRATVRIAGYGRPLGKDGKTWVLPGLEPFHGGFPQSYATTLGAALASRAARQSALTIRTTQQWHVRRKLELPKGSTVIGPPQPTSVAGGPLEATRSGRYGEVIEEDFRVSLATATVSATDYAGFAERVRTVDDGFLAGTRVTVPSAKAAGAPDGKGDKPTPKLVPGPAPKVVPAPPKRP